MVRRLLGAGAVGMALGAAPINASRIADDPVWGIFFLTLNVLTIIVGSFVALADL